jgi:hypothetical protein
MMPPISGLSGRTRPVAKWQWAGGLRPFGGLARAGGGPTGQRDKLRGFSEPSQGLAHRARVQPVVACRWGRWGALHTQQQHWRQAGRPACRRSASSTSCARRVGFGGKGRSCSPLRPLRESWSARLLRSRESIAGSALLSARASRSRQRPLHFHLLSWALPALLVLGHLQSDILESLLALQKQPFE